MSNFTAGTWENVLQVSSSITYPSTGDLQICKCAIPVVEGLFREYDDVVRAILFSLANWHSLAKLKQHSDSTLTLLDRATSDYGATIRRFAARVANLATKETPKEQQARSRSAALNASSSIASQPSSSTTNAAPRPSSDIPPANIRIRNMADARREAQAPSVPPAPKPKGDGAARSVKMSLSYIKLHLKAHVRGSIERVGSTNNTSTWRVRPGQIIQAISRLCVLSSR